MRSRGLTLVIATAIVVVVLLLADLLLAVTWAGYFPLDVRVENNQPIAIIQVEAATWFTQEWAEAIAGDPDRYSHDWKPVTILEDEQFTITVRCGGRRSMLGREISYVEHRYLAIRVKLASGESRVKVVEIPEGRRRRHVTVTMP